MIMLRAIKQTGITLVAKMLSTEFESHFAKWPAVYPHFKGVYSIDNFPKNLSNRNFFITNLSKQNEAGSHWISIIKSEPNLIEIFDSLGTQFDKLKPFLKFRGNPNFIYNDCAFQQQHTATCGYFAITFCIERVMNFDLKFKEILASCFLEDLNKNETFVTNFVRSM